MEGGFDLVEAGDRAGDREAGCEVGDEVGIFGTCAAAGLVVEVDDVEGDVGAGGAEEGKKGHGVCAAADGNGPGAGGDGRDG